VKSKLENLLSMNLLRWMIIWQKPLAELIFKLNINKKKFQRCHRKKRSSALWMCKLVSILLVE
jgi:hypothetical protein